MINGRYSKDNNNPTKQTKYIINLDAKNLSGKALTYPIRQFVFTWRTEEQWAKIDWVEQREDQYSGYFFELDLAYPPELLDSHNDYLLAPERVAVTSVS